MIVNYPVIGQRVQGSITNLLLYSGCFNLTTEEITTLQSGSLRDQLFVYYEHTVLRPMKQDLTALFLELSVNDNLQLSRLYTIERIIGDDDLFVDVHEIVGICPDLKSQADELDCIVRKIFDYICKAKRKII